MTAGAQRRTVRAPGAVSAETDYFGMRCLLKDNYIYNKRVRKIISRILLNYIKLISIRVIRLPRKRSLVHYINKRLIILLALFPVVP
jgi:hypothetical protein